MKNLHFGFSEISSKSGIYHDENSSESANIALPFRLTTSKLFKSGPHDQKCHVKWSIICTCMWNVVAERSSALDSSSGIVRMWVQIPAWSVAALVSLSKTLNHNCFVLRMGRKAVGPVCCVMHIKEPRTLIVKEKRLASMFLDSSCYWHLRCWMCK